MAILDEATSALDDANQKRLYERLRERGTTLISVAHRAAVAGFHRHVLKLTGGRRWSLGKTPIQSADKPGD
jgi:vitamin B12/bleomycin/antimicrobial peptide transport system ATP-binding/permease protein